MRACTVEAVFGHLKTCRAKAATTGKGNPGEGTVLRTALSHFRW